MTYNFTIEKLSDKIIRVKFSSHSEFDSSLLAVKFHKFLKSECVDYLSVVDCFVRKGDYTLGHIDLEIF